MKKGKEIIEKEELEVKNDLIERELIKIFKDEEIKMIEIIKEEEIEERSRILEEDEEGEENGDII